MPTDAIAPLRGFEVPNWNLKLCAPRQVFVDLEAHYVVSCGMSRNMTRVPLIHGRPRQISGSIVTWSCHFITVLLSGGLSLNSTRLQARLSSAFSSCSRCCFWFNQVRRWPVPHGRVTIGGQAFPSPSGHRYLHIVPCPQDRWAGVTPLGRAVVRFFRHDRANK